MRFENEFTVRLPVDAAWKVLTDLEGIAPCLPGAQLTGVDGDEFKGKVKVKVGPVISEYAGTARFVEKDDAAYRAVIDAKGKDSRGNGNAAALISAKLRADGSSTIVSVDADLNITGKIAQFGSGMMKEVSAKLLGQFADNLETMLMAPAEATRQPAAETSRVAESAGEATTRLVPPAVEPEPLHLLAVAGPSVTKRLLPVVAVLLAMLALIRHRRRKQ